MKEQGNEYLYSSPSIFINCEHLASSPYVHTLFSICTHTVLHMNTHFSICVHTSPYVYTLLHMSTFTSLYEYTPVSIWAHTLLYMSTHSSPYEYPLFLMGTHSSPHVHTLFPFVKTSESRFQTPSYIALKCQPASAKDRNIFLHKHYAPTRLKKININSHHMVNHINQHSVRNQISPTGHHDIHKFSSTLYCTSTALESRCNLFRSVSPPPKKNYLYIHIYSTWTSWICDLWFMIGSVKERIRRAFLDQLPRHKWPLGVLLG